MKIKVVEGIPLVIMRAEEFGGRIVIDGVEYYKLAGETDDEARARHYRIEAQRVAMHGPDWEEKYLARKYRELGIYQ